MTLYGLAFPYFPILLELDTYAPVTLDALAPVLALGPSPPEKTEALAPVLALGLALSKFDPNIPVHVTLPWGLTPDPLCLSITAPVIPGPVPSVPSNPSPAAAPTAHAPPGPAQWVAAS